MKRVAGAAIAVALATALTGALTACSSSSAPVNHDSSSASTPPPATSTPTTSAPTSSPAPAPLSRFEGDPGVKALRAWTAQAARTINGGHYIDAAFRALMTPALAATMKNVAGDDVRLGLRYPGPIPFTPTRVVVTSSTQRDVRICLVGDGFAVSKRTGKPVAKRDVEPIDAGTTLVNGTWLVSKFDTATFSCSGVRVQDVRW